MMFVEKYRPQEFEDVIGLDSTIPKLVGKDMPHFLFIGDAGTGKTTTAKIIIKKLGAEYLMINSSEERGIDAIREKVKNFASTLSTTGRPKIIFLDEMDGITIIAQQSMRNLMEEYSKNAKFILTANYENKIIDPIKSRCVKVIFKCNDRDAIIDRLRSICKVEKIEFFNPDLYTIAEMSKGDIRNAVNYLQRFSTTGKLIVEEPDDYTKEVIKLLKKGNFDEARKYVIENIRDFDGFLKDMFRELVEGDYSEATKKTAVREISEAMFKMYFVADKEIQVANALLNIMEYGELSNV